MNEELKKIREEVEGIFGGSKDQAHSLEHLFRVYNISMELCEKEGGDKDIVGAAALLHDLHRMIGLKDGRLVSGKESLPLAKEILSRVGFSEDKIDAVLHCIEAHDQYDFTKEGNGARSKEAEIIQDSDNIDAYGVMGIVRTFVFGTLHNRPMWDGKSKGGEVYDDSVIGDTSLEHVYDKILKLRDNMNTETARNVADEREKFMLEFMERFEREWRGEL